ncbi:hypothetical protein ACFSJS_27955, partial [Streptomyces desertarenae]
MIGIVVRVRGVVGSAVTIGGMSVGIVRVGSAVMMSAVSAVGSVGTTAGMTGPPTAVTTAGTSGRPTVVTIGGMSVGIVRVGSAVMTSAVSA